MANTTSVKPSGKSIYESGEGLASRGGVSGWCNMTTVSTPSVKVEQKVVPYAEDDRKEHTVRAKVNMLTVIHHKVTGGQFPVPDTPHTNNMPPYHVWDEDRQEYSINLACRNVNGSPRFFAVAPLYRMSNHLPHNKDNTLPIDEPRDMQAGRPFINILQPNPPIPQDIPTGYQDGTKYFFDADATVMGVREYFGINSPINRRAPESIWGGGNTTASSGTATTAVSSLVVSEDQPSPLQRMRTVFNSAVRLWNPLDTSEETTRLGRPDRVNDECNRMRTKCPYTHPLPMFSPHRHPQSVG